MFQAPRPRSRLAQSMMKPQYVASPGQLPHQFRPPGVGMPHNLPAHIGYGPVDRGPSQNSAFTGGRVTSPLASLVHPQPTESFSAPSFGGGGATAPTLAPFVSTPQGGEPTLPVAGAGAMPSPSPKPPQQPQTPVGLNTLVSHGYTPVGSIDYANPGRQVSTTAVGGLADTYEGSLPTPQPVTPTTLQTILALIGQKPNPSAAPVRYQV